MLEVKKDVQAVLGWFIRSAEQNHITACYNLGIIYLDGYDKIHKNYNEALKYFRIAADQGDVPSIYIIVQMYKDNKVMNFDHDESIKCDNAKNKYIARSNKTFI